MDGRLGLGIDAELVKQPDHRANEIEGGNRDDVLRMRIDGYRQREEKKGDLASEDARREQPIPRLNEAGPAIVAKLIDRVRDRGEQGHPGAFRQLGALRLATLV